MDERTENSYLSADILKTLRETIFFCCGKTMSACQIWESSHNRRKRGNDPPTRKAQLLIISETGAGAPDMKFKKKFNCLSFLTAH